MKIERFSTEPQTLWEFLTLSEKVYRADPHWIPPMKAKLFAQLSHTTPFFGEGELVHFLAREGDEPIGRISAMINSRSIEDGQPIGYVGFFECIADYSVAEQLLNESLNWLGEKKISIVRGPINGSTWHSYRFLTKGFEQAPFLLEPYNPNYYPAFFERFGFRVKKKYYSSIVTYHERQVQSAEEKLKKFAEMGYSVRPLDLKNFERELRLLYELSLEIFKDNWEYTEISWSGFRALYDGLERLVDPELVLFAYDPQRKPVGFVFAIPDYAEAVRQMGGESNLLAKLRFVLTRRKPEAAIVKTLGVLPEARQAGVGSVLVALAHRAIQQKGYTKAIHALMSEENASRKISEKSGEAFKEYAVYEIIL